MKKILHKIKGLKSLLCTAFAAVVLLASAVPAFALENGAYLVGRSTSYAHPETGLTLDGGTNIALGDSMCASIVEDQILVEAVDGKMYVTMGLGLMSNISSVQIEIVDQNGNFRPVDFVQTGSCQRNGDICNHYRFEMLPTDKYVSPMLFVDPMGRTVQFFVSLDLAGAVPGTGNYVSEMVPAAVSDETEPEVTPEVTPEATPEATPETTPEVTSEATPEVTPEVTQEVTPEATPEVTPETEENQIHAEDKNKESDEKGSSVTVIIVIVLVVLAVLAGVFFYKKRK